MKHFLRNLWHTEQDLITRLKAHYQERVKFSDNFIQSDLNYYDADKLWFWSQTPTFKYMGFREPAYLPEDMLLQLKRKESRRLGVWGVEIGIPYLACSPHLSPVPMREINYFYRLTDRLKTGTRLTASQLFDLTLLGGPDEIQKGMGWLYKHWLYAESTDKRALDQKTLILNEKAIRKFWDSPLRKDFDKLLWNFLEQDRSIARTLRRSIKWELLRLEKEKRYEDRIKSFGILTLITKIMLFLKNYGKSFK